MLFLVSLVCVSADLWHGFGLGLGFRFGLWICHCVGAVGSDLAGFWFGWFGLRLSLVWLVSVCLVLVCLFLGVAGSASASSWVLGFGFGVWRCRCFWAVWLGLAGFRFGWFRV